MGPETATCPRARELFRASLGAVHERTDALFARLLVAQWVAAVACALWIAPKVLHGEESPAHPHVLGSVVFGGLITAVAVAMTRWRRGAPLTRHMIAAAQLLWSALLIDVTADRIDTSFHVFGSLALLAFYRDWRVLVTGTLVVAADRWLRGQIWPDSVFGIYRAGNWRWLEHVGWVLFEGLFLVQSSQNGLREMRVIAERQAALEQSKEAIEDQVRERTSELVEANRSLAASRDALKKANQDLRNASTERETLHDRLVRASREAGMAEVATGVLHNVGNVLNSVNVSAQVVCEKIRTSELSSLLKAAELIRANLDHLADYIGNDERGKHIPRFLVEVARCLADEQKEVEGELRRLLEGVEHVKHVVTLQQEHAKRSTVRDSIRPDDVVNAALAMQDESMRRHDVTVRTELADIPPVVMDKHTVLQILINLISNARQAMDSRPHRDLLIRTFTTEDGARVCFEVVDTGMGIERENLTRIFQHGFTTKTDGHGFGLHSAGVAAQAMGGSLTAHSDGPGTGARFVLSLPTTPQESQTTGKGTACTAS
jgi:signal transduction histidine kinase